MAKTRRILQHSGLALTTSPQSKSAEVIDPMDDITGIDIELTVNATGTLTGAKNVLNAIQKLTIVDRKGSSIMDIDGTDIDKVLQILSPNGSYVTPDTTTEATDKYFKGLLNLPIQAKDQACKVLVTFNPYSSLATSGCTGATVDLDVRAWYGNAQSTLRIHKKTLTLTTDDNEIGYKLSDALNTLKLAFVIGTESNINHIKFSSAGQVDEYSAMPLQQLINFEKMLYKDGHQTGLFNLFIDPFMSSTSLTKLSLNMGSADTLLVYQVATN